MEKYFRPVKSLRTRNKKSYGGGECFAETRHTSRSPVEQDETDNKESPDTLLWVEDGEDGQHVTCWRPGSPYSLGSDEEEYVAARQVVLAAPQSALKDAEGRWSLQPIILKEHRHTSLCVLVPGYPLEGALFSTAHHLEEGHATLQLDFPKVMDYLRNVYETGIHVFEVVQGETHATTRLIIGSWQDPRMPDLPFCRPTISGGPFFRDIDGNYAFSPTVRSYRSTEHLPHDLEFFFALSSEQRSRLGELCSETHEDPRETSDE